MPEEQNHDNVTLADILNEIKGMRDEGKRQHRHSVLISGLSIVFGMTFVGLGVCIASNVSSFEWWQGVTIIICGAAVYAWLVYLYRRSKKS